MDARKSAIFASPFVKLILQTIAHLIQYTVLEIQFWSVKSTTVTVPYTKILRAFPFLPIEQCKQLHYIKTDQGITEIKHAN